MVIDMIQQMAMRRISSPRTKQTMLDYRRLSEISMNTTPQFPQLVAT
jgi:hypothetical protein